ncbi:histidine phosphatase family protein [Nitrospira sp. Kam-Ns4a]
MPILYLVRHGETDWNRSGQIMGERPVPLNETGERQARRLAGHVAGLAIRALCSSPVARARQTAEILAARLHLPVTEDRGLTEIGLGEWEGLFWRDLPDEITRRNLYAAPEETCPPGGETLRAVQERAVAAVERVLAREPDGPILCVSHADVVRAIVAHYSGLSLRLSRQLRVDHASLTGLSLHDGAAELLVLNYVPAAPDQEPPDPLLPASLRW